jgi:YD repeat-containing protein
MLSNGGTYNYTHPVTSQYSYLYAYDGLNHLVEKKQPGREKETYVRDRAGREMMYQDGNMHIGNQWLCTAYDNLNRVTRKYVTTDRVGNITPAASGITVPQLPTATVLYEAMHYGYNSGTSDDPTDALPYAATNTVSLQDFSDNTHGELKYEKHLLLIEGTQELYKETAYYYNNKGELLQSVTRYPNGNILRTSYRYNFTGDITTKEEVYNGVTKLTNCTYDNRGKLLTETTTINGGAAATVTYAYDDLGRVTSRTCGNGTSETQQYNIQGWATTMSAKRGQNNIYTQTLHYYNPVKGTAALYSGNISEWSSQQASLQQETYGFTYDLQGRLTQSNRYSGTSTTAQNAYTERGITYDKNGNILTLQRYAAATAQCGMRKIFAGKGTVYH